MPAAYKVEAWSESFAPDPVKLRQILLAAGYDVIEWSDDPTATYGFHDHPEDQSHWVVSGKLELIVAGAGTYSLGPGDRDFMPAGTQHAARVIGEKPVRYLIGKK